MTGFGGIIAPLIIWQVKKDEIKDMDAQGKEVMNFQISMFIYYAMAFILCFIFIGFILLGILAILNILFPILQGIRAKDGKPVSYPLTFRFIS